MNRLSLPGLLLLATALTAPAGPGLLANGIPAPDMVIYGKVTRGTTLLTSGRLEWTYTPQNGAPPVVVSTRLGEFSGPGGQTFSYIAQIPIEQTFTDAAAAPNTLSLSTNPLSVTRSATLDGRGLFFRSSEFGESMTLNIVDFAGQAENVDLDLYDPNDCCPGDGDRDGFVTLVDYRSVRDNFGDPTPAAGDASCDSFVNMSDYLSVRDNLGITCPPPQTRSEGGEDAPLPVTATVESVASIAEAPVGELLELRLIARSAGPVGAFALVVEFDPKVIEFAGGSTNRTLFNAQELTTDPRIVEPGRVVIAGGAFNPIGEGSYELASVNFRGLETGEAVVRLLDAGPFAAAMIDGGFAPVGVGVPVPSVGFSVIPAPDTSVPDWNLFTE
jgi:hypothetical protein